MNIMKFKPILAVAAAVGASSALGDHLVANPDDWQGLATGKTGLPPSAEGHLEITDSAAQKIAEEAAKSSRIGARALKSIYGKIIKPFEFDPFAREEVKSAGEGHHLVLDDEIVATALKPPF